MGCKKLTYHKGGTNYFFEKKLKVVYAKRGFSGKKGLNYSTGGSIMPGRSFSVNSYRYGYNEGSEKDDEITGVTGSHFTTFYREGDTRLLKWWSTDPKQHASWSPYAYMNGNPIWYNDQLGDTVRISFRTGFLGLGKRQEVNFDAGTLTNLDGSAFTGKQRGFLKQTVNALNSASSSREGGEAIEELVSSNNIFTIKRGSSNSFSPTSAFKSSANIPSLQAFTGNNRGSTGSGGTVFFNPSSTQGGLDVTGSRSRPSFVALAHEIFHARDANQGVLFPDDYTNPITGKTYLGTDQGLKKSEWRAVFFENTLRQQLGMNLREYYGVQIGANGNASGTGPRLLDKKNQPIPVPIK